MKTACGHPLCNPDPDVLDALEEVGAGFHVLHSVGMVKIEEFSECGHPVCARVTEILEEVHSGNESQGPQSPDTL